MAIEKRKCAAKSKRTGEHCGQWAVPGATVCKWHGGGAPAVKAAAARRLAMAAAEQAVVTFGLPREIDPRDALLEEVYRTAGHVAWLAQQVQALKAEDVIWGRTEQVEKQASEFPGVDTTHGAKANMWVELYHRERKHLVDVCKAALAAGVEERRVKLAEQMGGQLAAVIRGVLGDLGLTAEQWALVPDALARHVAAVTGA